MCVCVRVRVRVRVCVCVFVCSLWLSMYRVLTTCCVEVEWDVEKACFETFARETADFFAVKAKWLSTLTDADEPTQQVSSSSLL